MSTVTKSCEGEKPDRAVSFGLSSVFLLFSFIHCSVDGEGVPRLSGHDFCCGYLYTYTCIHVRTIKV